MSDAVSVTLACGCTQVVLGSIDLTAPVCRTHDERRVQRVTAPPPRITAVNCAASGPLVRTHAR